MNYSPSRARLEAALSRAHRNIVSAKQAADDLGEDGVWLDLQLIETEITRLAEDSLKGGRRPKPRERPTGSQ